MKTTNTLRIVSIFGLFLLHTAVIAQQPAPADTIVFTSGKQIAVRLDELGLDEVKYHAIDDNVVVSVEKTDVARIHMGNGKIIHMTADAFNVGFSKEVMRKTHVVKVEFLSFALDHITMSYEQVLKPWMNLEVRATGIGAGNQNMQDQCVGFGVAGGIKFISRPDHLSRGMKLGHPLHGRYVRPELVFNRFTSVERHNDTYTWSSGYSTIYERSPIHYTNVAFNVVLGKQRFLGDGVTLDTWVGIGYGFQSIDGEQANEEALKSYCYNYAILGADLPIAVSAGISLGVAF